MFSHPASVLYSLAAFGMSFFPLSNFLHFPIDFLFADFAGCSADNLDPKTFPHELAVHVGIMPAEPIVLGWRENSLVVQNGADAP